MRNTIKIGVIIFLFAFTGCSVSRNTSESKTNDCDDSKNLDFYFAFTEATKQALFNNFNEAINLYKQCIRANPKSSASYFQLSNIYMRLGNMNLAKEYSKKAIELNRNNKWYYYHLASLYQMKNELDSALTVYEKLVRIDHSNMETHINMILLYVENKQFKKALHLLKKVKGEAGNNERLVLIEHDIYQQSGKKKMAEKVLEEGIKTFPDNIELKGLLAEYYADNQEMEKAQEYYDLMNRNEPDNIRVRMSYAEFLLGDNKKTEAYQVLKDIISDKNIASDTKMDIIISIYSNKELFENFKKETLDLVNILKQDNNDNIRIYYLSADIRSRLNDYQGVAEDLKYIYTLEKDNPAILEQIAQIENFLGNYDSVIFYADLALTTLNKPVFYILKGNAFIQMNEYDNAIRSLRTGLKSNPSKEDKIQIFNLLGECFRNKMMYDESDRYFEEALKLDYSNILIRNNYSYYLALRNEKLEKAEELSRMTIETEPENPTYLDTYAWILYKMNKNDKAKKFVEKALKFGGSNNPEILDHYGMILVKEKNYDEAVKIFEKALLLDKDNSEIADKISKIKNLIKSGKK